MCAGSGTSKGHDGKESYICSKASQSQNDVGDQAEECAQALKFVKGHDWKQSHICTQASQSQTDIGDQAEECAQALRLLKGGHGVQSKIFTQVNTPIILKPFQASRSQKEHGKQAEEYVQALKLLKGHNGKQSNRCTQVFINRKPKWLARFLKRTFFYPCPKHYTGRNELNQYCIDCDTPLCKCCLSISPSPHADHRLLKLYRHVYKDVVLLDELKRHIDCSQIQPYKCNKQVVLALTPLPHTGAKIKEEARCYTCKRRLFQYDSYNFCSISCKVVAFSKKKIESGPPFLSIHEPEKPKVSDRRKGIPQRSPLF